MAVELSQAGIAQTIRDRTGTQHLERRTVITTALRRNRDMTLSKEAEELLVNVWELGVVNVWAHNLAPAGELVRAGLVEARDATDGPWLCLTERGKRHIDRPARARA